MPNIHQDERARRRARLATSPVASRPTSTRTRSDMQSNRRAASTRAPRLPQAEASGARAPCVPLGPGPKAEGSESAFGAQPGHVGPQRLVEPGQRLLLALVVRVAPREPVVLVADHHDVLLAGLLELHQLADLVV